MALQQGGQVVVLQTSTSLSKVRVGPAQVFSIKDNLI